MYLGAVYLLSTLPEKQQLVCYNHSNVIYYLRVKAPESGIKQSPKYGTGSILKHNLRKFRQSLKKGRRQHCNCNSL